MCRPLTFYLQHVNLNTVYVCVRVCCTRTCVPLYVQSVLVCTLLYVHVCLFQLAVIVQRLQCDRRNVHNHTLLNIKLLTMQLSGVRLIELSYYNSATIQ